MGKIYWIQQIIKKKKSKRCQLQHRDVDVTLMKLPSFFIFLILFFL